MAAARLAVAIGDLHSAERFPTASPPSSSAGSQRDRAVLLPRLAQRDTGARQAGGVDAARVVLRLTARSEVETVVNGRPARVVSNRSKKGGVCAVFRPLDAGFVLARSRRSSG